MKLSPRYLNLGPCLQHPTSIYTCGVTTTPRVCGGDLMVLGCKKCDCSLVLKNTDLLTIKNTLVNYINITVHTWCDGHSTSINACGVWGAKVGVQVSRRELHTHILRLG